MIALDHVDKSYRTIKGRKVVLADVSACLPEGRNLGILGLNGAGKSTLIRLLAGAETPDRGRVRRTRRVSFPLGFGGTFHGALSGRENARFLARLYGADLRKTLRFADEFAELGDYFRMPVETYSSGMRAKLAFALCLAIDFDVYLIDELIAVGDARFQARCRAAFDSRMSRADIVMVTHSIETMRRYCDSGALLQDGRLTLYDDLAGAVDAYGAVLERLDRAEMRRPA